MKNAKLTLSFSNAGQDGQEQERLGDAGHSWSSCSGADDTGAEGVWFVR